MIYFTASPEDIGQSWLNFLFSPVASAYPTISSMFGDVSATMPNPFGGGALQSALQNALGFYSSAMLIIAAFILFYHLTAMVAETAHHGKAMGDRANKIWAPIRLVMAVGLLVPVAGGLNSGQYIVVKMASLGSALASNIWGVFLTNLASYNSQAIPPNAPMVQSVALDIIKMEACAYAWNSHVSEIAAVFPSLASAQITPSTMTYTLGATKGTKTSYSSNTVDGVDMCGWYFIPADNSTSNASLQSGLAVAASQAQSAAIASNLASFQSVGQTIAAVMPATTQATATQTAQDAATALFAPMLQNAVAKYQSAVQQNLAQITQADQVDLNDVANTIQPYGWVMAGTFLNTITRVQASIGAAAADSAPKTAPPALRIEDFANKPSGGFWSMLSGADSEGGADIRRNTALDLASFDYYQKQIIADPASPVSDVGCAAMLGLNNSDGTAATEIGTNSIGRKLSGIGSWTGEKIFGAVDLLATQNGVWQAGNNVGCGGNSPSNFSLGVQITNSDPFAQMAFLGHSNLDVGFGLLTLGMGAGLIDSTVGGTFAFLSLLFFVCGFTLAYLVPLMPFMRFFFGVVAWFAGLIEAIVAIPLVALAHLNPEGDGMAGGAKTGYQFIFNLFLRPTLMIFGLICGLIIFLIALSFLNYVYAAAVAGGGGTAYGHAAMSRMIYSILYVALVVICSNHCFALIDHLPNQALKWMGTSSQAMPQIGEASHTERYVQGISAIAGKEMIGTVTGLATPAGRVVATVGKSAAFMGTGAKNATAGLSDRLNKKQQPEISGIKPRGAESGNSEGI